MWSDIRSDAATESVKAIRQDCHSADYLSPGASVGHPSARSGLRSTEACTGSLLRPEAKVAVEVSWHTSSSPAACSSTGSKPMQKPLLCKADALEFG